jgi:hypothetical protein
MNPHKKGQMHTFILPPGGYRIAVNESNRTGTWYGKSSGYWLPVGVPEGETVYLTFDGTNLARSLTLPPAKAGGFIVLSSHRGAPLWLLFSPAGGRLRCPPEPAGFRNGFKTR